MNKIAIIKELKRTLNKQFNGLIEEVILFGSQASNQDDEHSDYDILIIIDTEITPGVKDKIISICYDIDMKYGILTDTHILSTSELDTLRGKQPIFSDAINYGIHV